jgi:hypothetical protein
VEPFASFESGFAVGRWVVPEAGFGWRDDLRPWMEEGDGPWLVANPGRLRRYPLLQRTALLGAFVNLAARPTQHRIKRFGSVWGHLGVPTTLVPIGAKGNVSDWTSGEPLSAWQSAAYEFSILYRLAQDILTAESAESWSRSAVRAAQERLAKAFRQFGSRIYFVPPFDPELEPHAGKMWRDVVTPVTADDELRDRLTNARPLTIARYFLAREVNQHLEDVHLAVLPFVGNRIRIVPKTLEAAIYMRLAQYVSRTGDSGIPERPCDFCGVPFFPGRANQKYCSRSHLEAASYRRKRVALGTRM